MPAFAMQGVHMVVQHGEEPPEAGGDPACWAHIVSDDDPPLTDGELAAILEGLSDAVIVTDTQGRIVVWNQGATRVFGWPAGQMIGVSLDEIIPERLRARHWVGFRRAMSEGTTRHGTDVLEVPAVHRDGHTISIAFTVSLVFHPGSGELTGIAAVVRDDSERRQERQRVLGELEELRALHHTTPAPEPPQGG